MVLRITAWLISLLSIITSVGYLIWIDQGSGPTAEQSRLYPIPVVQRILSQIAAAASPLEWNIPYLSIIVWIAWIFSMLTCGMALRRGLRAGHPAESASFSLFLSFAVGFAVFGLLQLAIGLMGLARFPLIPVFFTIGSLTLLLPAQRLQLLRVPRAVHWQWTSLPAYLKVLIAIAVVSFAALILPALTPPTQSDGVRYHIGAVQEYIKLGGIRYLPLNAYSNMPFLVEMHYLAALACRAPEATQLIHLTLGLFTCLGIYTLVCSLSHVRDKGSRLAALAAAALYLATPMSAVLATWPFTDHGISLFLIASSIAVIRPIEQSRWWETGLLLGALLGTKYTMAPVALALLPIPFFINSSSSASPTSPRLVIWKNIFLISAVAGITGGVWYLKNLFYTGNPFYPLASQLFPGGEWTPETNQFLHDRADAKGIGKSMQLLLLSPWNATFSWLKFETHNPGATIILALLSVITALVASLKKPRHTARLSLALVAIFTYVIWFFSYQSNRLLLPTLGVMLAVIPVEVFASIPERRMSLTRLIIAFAIAGIYGLGWALQWSLVTTGLTPPPLPYLLGNQDKGVFRYQSLTSARAFDYLNERVKPGDKVLLIGEHRIYGAHFSAVWSDWFDTPALAHLIRQHNIATLDDLLNHLESQNIRWVLINDAELAPQLNDFQDRFTDAEWQLYEQLRQLESPVAKPITLPPGVLLLQLAEAE